MSLPKQFLRLSGRPLYRWGLDALIQGGCRPVIVAAPVDAQEALTQDLRDLDVVEVVRGGETRQGSVANALARVQQDIVVVHDAARPVADAALVREVVERVEAGAAGAVAAAPADDTLKLVHDGVISETVDRRRVWRAQTPAAYRTSVLQEAHEIAMRDAFVGTDEAQLVERLGAEVVIVPTRIPNLKVTYGEDLRMAEALLSERERS